MKKYFVRSSKEYSFNKLSSNSKQIIYQQNACYCLICATTNEGDQSIKVFTAELLAGLSF